MPVMGQTPCTQATDPAGVILIDFIRVVSTVGIEGDRRGKVKSEISLRRAQRGNLSFPVGLPGERKGFFDSAGIEVDH